MIFNVSLWLKQVDLVKQLVSYYPNDLAWATTADEIEKGFASGDHDKEDKWREGLWQGGWELINAKILVKRKASWICSPGRIASLVGVESGHAIGGSLAILRTLYKLDQDELKKNILIINLILGWAPGTWPSHTVVTPRGQRRPRWRKVVLSLFPQRFHFIHQGGQAKNNDIKKVVKGSPSLVRGSSRRWTGWGWWSTSHMSPGSTTSSSLSNIPRLYHIKSKST